ncbi:Serine/threonine-protein phosphatase 1 regulatory subunit 10, partial [Trichinella sp. T8]
LVLMPPKAKKLQSTLDMICTPGIALVNDARGIAASGSATDFVQCMRNASTWAVRMIFLSSIKDTAEEDRKKILEAGAWDLLLTWLIEGEKSENWEFLSKLLQLFIDLPVYVDLLKSNSTPKLIKRLSKRTNISTEVRNLSVDIVMIWKDIIMDEINVKGAEVCKRNVCPTLELGSPTAAVSVPSTSGLVFPSLESSSTANLLSVEPAIRTPPNLSCSAKSSATAGIPCIVVAPRGRGKPVKPIFSDQKKDDLVKLNKIDLADAEQSVEVKDELLPVKPEAVKPIETRKKTAKTYPIKLRSTGLEEEVPMPKMKRTRLEKNDSTDLEPNVDGTSAVNENKPTDAASTAGIGQVRTKTKGSLLLDSGGFEAALGVVSAPKVMVTKRKKTTPKVAISKSPTNSSEPELEKPDLLQLERSSCEVTSSSAAWHADSLTGRKSALSGKKKSKPYRVTWAPDDELVSINYFELEPDERVNVSKFQGHGDDLKHVEMLQERELLRTRWASHGEDLDLPEISGVSTDNSPNSPSWKLVPISGISEAKKVAVCSEEKMRWDETKLNPLPSIFYSTQTGVVDAPKETEVERSSGNHSTTKTIPLIAEGASTANPKVTATGSSQQNSAVNVVPGFRKNEFDFSSQPPVTVSAYQYSNSVTPIDSHQPNMAGAPPLNFPLNPNAPRPYGPIAGTSAFPAPRKMMMPRAGPPGMFNGPMRVGPPVDMKGIPAGRGFGGPNGEPAPPMSWNAPPQPNCSSLGLLGHAPVEPPFSHGRGRASFMPPGPGGRFANPTGGFRAPRAGGGPGAAGVTGMQRPPCVFFQRGCCGFGDRCRFPHIK